MSELTLEAALEANKYLGSSSVIFESCPTLFWVEMLLYLVIPYPFNPFGWTRTIY